LTIRFSGALVAYVSLVATTSVARAQNANEVPRRTRVILGPQLVPSYPGADRFNIRPFVDVSRARGDEPFAFEAADEGFAVPLFQSSGFSVGPALGFQGKRSRGDVGGALPSVGFTVEVGGFVQYQLVPSVRLRTEIRRGFGGHKGLIGTLGADYLLRDADRWLFSIGPRVTLANDRYQRAYFGVRPGDAAGAGLPAFNAKGGVESVGLVAGFNRQVSARWGVFTYAKYDRLVDDASRSPVVRRFGSRDQPSGGIALTYTFGARR